MPFQQDSLRVMIEVARANEIITQRNTRRFRGTPRNTAKKDECYRLAGQYLRSIKGDVNLIMAGLPAARMADNVAQVLEGYGFSSSHINLAEYTGFENDEGIYNELLELYKGIETTPFDVEIIHGSMCEQLSSSKFYQYGFNVLDFDLIANLWSESGRPQMSKIVDATYNSTKPKQQVFVLVNDCRRGRCGSPPDRWVKLASIFDQAWTDKGFKILDSGGPNYSGGQGSFNTKWWYWLETPSKPPLAVRKKLTLITTVEPEPTPTEPRFKLVEMNGR